MKTRATTLLSLTIALYLVLSTSAATASKSYSVSVVPVGPTPQVLHHSKPFSKMSLSEVEQQQERALSRYLYVSRFFLRWRVANYERMLLSATTKMPTCSATGVREPHNYCWYAKAADWTRAQLVRTQEKLAANKQDAFPPHHALWGCIAGHESGGDPFNKHNPSYRGYLQMSYGWLGLISGDPADHSQAEQEWAAETGYSNSGYSSSFLYGQWFDYDGAAGECLQYA